MKDESDDKDIKDALTRERDTYEKIMSQAREERARQRLKNRTRQSNFLKKIGELSLGFGSVIVPGLIATHNTNLPNGGLTYVLIGVGLYLVNGIIALWRVKSILEIDADDLPFIGLDEEIHTYPIINSINKLLLYLDDEELRKEYSDTKKRFLDFAFPPKKEFKASVSFWLDFVICNFVLASLLVAKAIWPYGQMLYWIIFVIIAALMISLIVLSYIRTLKSQMNLYIKRERLTEIKSSYQTWFNSKILGQ